jgi:hypothetical protein
MMPTQSIYFDSRRASRWPYPEEIRHFFFPKSGEAWFSTSGNDTASFSLEGVEGTEHLEFGRGRIDIDLGMIGHPQYGVQLNWARRGPPRRTDYYSLHDPARLNQYVNSLHGDPQPIGLYIPFAAAWKAVEDFLLNDGARSTRITWIDGRDLPPDAFPPP